MNPREIILATEDAVSEALALRLLERAGLIASSSIGKQGESWLRTWIRDLNRTAAKKPVVVFTDQDRPKNCPALLFRKWANAPKSPNLIFRVAVMEAESWVLADRESTAEFLGVPATKIPLDTDSIPDPKRHLVNLARKSRRAEIRRALAPRDGSTAQVGPEYNARVPTFVAERWDPESAARCSASLRRAMNRLREFAAR